MTKVNPIWEGAHGGIRLSLNKRWWCIYVATRYNSRLYWVAREIHVDDFKELSPEMFKWLIDEMVRMVDRYVEEDYAILHALGIESNGKEV